MTSYIIELPRLYDKKLFKSFIERIDIYFDIHDIPEEKRKLILLASITDDYYIILRNLFHPILPRDKTYSEIREALAKQFDSKNSTVFCERYKFYNAKQSPNEPVLNWYARIKKLSMECQFPEDNIQSILLDRFVSGLAKCNTNLLDELCTMNEDTLTLQKAIDIALRKENIEKHMHGKSKKKSTKKLKNAPADADTDPDLVIDEE